MIRGGPLLLLALLLGLLPAPVAAAPTEFAGLQPAARTELAAGWRHAALDPRLGMSEGWRDPAALRLSRAGVDRVLFSWAAIEPDGPASFQPDRYFPPALLRADRQGGRDIVGLIQFTPAWAARDPSQGERSVPIGLGDPNGPWAQFVSRLARHYRGQVSAWMIWNEMDFRPGDNGAGGSWTWDGTDAEYWQLLKDAYRAVKAADPDAQVVLGPTAYWVDVVNGRSLFVKRLLKLAAQDPEAADNNWFFDAIAMNLYRAPDDIYRVFFELQDTLKRAGIAKPLWVTELNCMPFDDPQTPKPDDHQRCTLEEQAAFTIQAFAMALAAGWSRALWYQLTDNHIWREQEVWGLEHDDGSPRPAFQAYQTASTYLTHGDRYTFAPLKRSTRPWGVPWPDNPGSYYPNWLVYQVVVDRGSERVSVLWNASGKPLQARIPKQGEAALLVDKLGRQQPLEETAGWYVVDLAPATAVGPTDPPGYYYVGGDPLLIVQEGVPSGTPVVQPVLGAPR